MTQTSLMGLCRIACRTVMSEGAGSSNAPSSALNIGSRFLHASGAFGAPTKFADVFTSDVGNQHADAAALEQSALHSNAQSSPAASRSAPEKPPSSRSRQLPFPSHHLRSNPSSAFHAPSLTPLRCFTTSSLVRAGGDIDSRSAPNSQDKQQQPPATPSEPSSPVQNPLQAALAAAEAASGGAAGAGGREGGGPGGAPGRRRRRTWMWYDAVDEREERQKERQREQYEDAGTTYLLDIPQSMKKMDRIVKLVRGLSYSEAVAQCQLVPHKAARYVIMALEKAYEDATEEKRLNGERLVVDTIFVTKGVYEKGMQPLGRGMSGRMFTRKSHLRVALRESDPKADVAVGPLSLRGPLGAQGPVLGRFTARQVDPLMATWTAGLGWQTRQRFAYRTEA